MSAPSTSKVALVTGSGRGIGAATALKLARDGFDVVVNDLSRENADSVADQIRGIGRKAHAGAQDVSNYEQARQLVSESIAALGRIDVLVNNAGITRDAMLHKMTEAQWDEVIRVNLKGPFNMAQACAAAMVPRKSGRIINISSVSWLGNIGQTNYAASKAGVVGMTKTMALELARFGVTVNAIAPGFVESALTQAMPPEIVQKIVGKIPLGRIGQPEDIAGLVAFLASDQAAYLTGQVIHMDGGITVGVSGS